MRVIARRISDSMSSRGRARIRTRIRYFSRDDALAAASRDEHEATSGAGADGRLAGGDRLHVRGRDREFLHDRPSPGRFAQRRVRYGRAAARTAAGTRLAALSLVRAEQVLFPVMTT